MGIALKQLLFRILMGMLPFLSLAASAQSLSIEALQQQADSLFAKREFAQAATSYQELYSRLEAFSDQKARTAFSIAICYQRQAIRDRAEQYYLEAARIFKQLGNTDNYYLSKVRVAGLLSDQGRYGEAILITEEAIAWFETQKDSFSVASQLNNLGLYFYRNEEVQQSIAAYSRAIEWLQDKDDALKAKCYNQLGNIWATDLGDEEKGLEYYRKSLVLKLRSASPESISAAYNNIGISHKELLRPDSALFYYKHAYDYALRSGIPEAKINPLINIANLYKNQGKPQEAVSTYKKVLAFADRMNLRQQVNVHTNLGVTYNTIEEFEAALHHLYLAEKMAINSGHRADMHDIEVQKAIAYRGVNAYKKAYEAQVRSKAHSDSIYQKERDREIADLLIRYEASEKDRLLLESEQQRQQKELETQRLLNLFLFLLALILLAAGVIFYLFKKKQSSARQAMLELKLAEQKELARIQTERLRISRELHDNIGSYLTLLSASVEQLSPLQQEIPEQKIADLQECLSMSMRELRKTVWLLNNHSVSIEEIAYRLRDFFKPLQQQKMHISVEVSGYTQQHLSEIQTTHLFRVVQEAVSNALRHSSCSRILISLDLDSPEKLCFSVTDNGCGFDPEAERKESGNGRYNMKSRMEELRGEWRILSAVGKGTTVEGCFPI